MEEGEAGPGAIAWVVGPVLSSRRTTSDAAASSSLSLTKKEPPPSGEELCGEARVCRKELSTRSSWSLSLFWRDPSSHPGSIKDGRACSADEEEEDEEEDEDEEVARAAFSKPTALGVGVAAAGE